MTLIAVSFVAGEAIARATAGTSFELPMFVCVLFVAVLIANVLAWADKPVVEHAAALIGNVSLALFLAMALMTLRLWDLAALALPVATILLAQTLLMIVYARYITFHAMDPDYDAVVLTAGHCGFGLGATPTAIANMQAVTARFAQPEGDPVFTAFLPQFVDMTKPGAAPFAMLSVSFLMLETSTIARHSLVDMLPRCRLTRTSARCSFNRCGG